MTKSNYKMFTNFYLKIIKENFEAKLDAKDVFSEHITYRNKVDDNFSTTENISAPKVAA